MITAPLYNMERRTNYGVSFHERNLIKRITDQLSRATSLTRKARLGRRLEAAKNRLQVHEMLSLLQR